MPTHDPWRTPIVTGLLHVGLATFMLAATADTQPLVPRLPPTKPAHTRLGPMHDPGVVVVKFSEGTDFRLKSDSSPSFTVPPSHFETLRGVLQSHSLGMGFFERLFTRSEAALDAEREEAQDRSGRYLADLNLYFKIRLPDGADAAGLCDDLNALPFVELAEPMPRPAPPPVDILPPTPDFTPQQHYRDSHSGIGTSDVMFIPGWDGTGFAVVDVEYAWVLDHEDLELPPHANIDIATIDNPFPDTEGSHGTAVLGIIGAKENGYGVTGLSPGAVLKVAPQNTVEHGHNIARAISIATAALLPGDVILLETQTCVCELQCDDGTQDGYGPSEYRQPVFDSTATATALGIVVVAAAGNGNVNLDDLRCGGRFDRSVRDSGAIIVGGGDSTNHSKLWFSTYGRRVDLQGWGHEIVTTGYGDLFNPGDIRQRYSRRFSGTSGASPIVTGAVLSIQGMAKAAGLPPLSPEEVRELLVTTGTPQGVGGHIGPLPNLPAAAEELLRTDYALPYILADGIPGRQGFVRIVNRSGRAGTVSVTAIDDAGRDAGTETLNINAYGAIHFNSRDLERGNADKGLAGVGAGTGHWRLVLTSSRDIQPLVYVRTDDGFVTRIDEVESKLDVASNPLLDLDLYRYITHFVYPASDQSQRSYLRLINWGSASTDIFINAYDDTGARRGPVWLSVPAGHARHVTATELETGQGLNGSFGTGVGKWRLTINAFKPIQVMSLLQTPTGHLTNLSGVPVNTDVDISPTPPDDHGDSRSTATGVQVPSITSGSLESEGDKDYFRIDLQQARFLVVETTGTTDTLGTLSRGGVVVDRDDDSGFDLNFRIIVPMAQAGTWYVEVRGYTPTSTGNYTFNVGWPSRGRVVQ